MSYPTYLEAISQGFPLVEAGVEGDGSVYETIYLTNEYDVDRAPLPTKESLEPIRRSIAQTRAWVLIQAERDRRRSGGVKVGINWYHSDDTSRIQQIGLVMFGAAMPPNISWKTMAGTFVTMTPALAMGIFQTTAGSEQAIFARAEYHRAMMLASAAPELYNFSGGWPLTYEEWAALPPP